MTGSVTKQSAGVDLRADRARALELTPVTPDVAERLDRLVALLLQWKDSFNLVATSTVHHIWSRHIADSLQLVALAPEARLWVDLGSGAGFPGLVIACALAKRAGTRVHLVEGNAKKAAFLREAVRLTGAPAVVRAQRAEAFMRLFNKPVDVVTARALAPLAKLLELAHPLLKKGAKGLFLKGQDVEAELTEAAKCWTIDYTLVPSKTNPVARIIVIHSAERHGKQ